ncbi:MAG: hypothetical protein E7211_03875 [Clostridium lundense]|nr:hypothetical protein [Clostridium lundense]
MNNRERLEMLNRNQRLLNVLFTLTTLASIFIRNYRGNVTMFAIVIGFMVAAFGTYAYITIKTGLLKRTRFNVAAFLILVFLVGNTIYELFIH